MTSVGTKLTVWVVGHLAADPPHDPDVVHLISLTMCELETQAGVSLCIVNGDILEVCISHAFWRMRWSRFRLRLAGEAVGYGKGQNLCLVGFKDM